MKALRFLASRWVLSFVGVAILALLVWFFGPLLPLLEGWVPRLAVVAEDLLSSGPPRTWPSTSPAGAVSKSSREA